MTGSLVGCSAFASVVGRGGEGAVLVGSLKLMSCSLLSGTGNVSALDDNLILGINTTLPLNLLSLLIILHWSTFLLTFNTTILVPLQSPSSGSKFLSKITGQPTLRLKDEATQMTPSGDQLIY